MSAIDTGNTAFSWYFQQSTQNSNAYNILNQNNGYGQGSSNFVTYEYEGVTEYAVDRYAVVISQPTERSAWFIEQASNGQYHIVNYDGGSNYLNFANAILGGDCPIPLVEMTTPQSGDIWIFQPVKTGYKLSASILSTTLTNPQMKL